MKVRSACENLLHEKEKRLPSFYVASMFPCANRHLENDKNHALRKSKGDFDAPLWLCLPSLGQNWLGGYIISLPQPKLSATATLTSFLLLMFVMQAGELFVEILPLWGTLEYWRTNQPYNYLELKAVLRSLCCTFTKKHILVQSDNTTAVAYINAIGGIKSMSCDNMATAIWEWRISRTIWLSASHIPGPENTQACR